MAMDSFTGKLAVVTGGGSGMGRELTRQLAAEGCSVAACDLHADTIAETVSLASASSDVLVTGHVCDVAVEEQVLRFRDELLAAHSAEQVNLLFSNAGIGGGGSFVNDSREEWERVFAVDFYGVYYCARAFLPLLIASGDGVIVNTSSVNGFWAALGPGLAQSAYATAKFAVRGFTESLIEDLRSHATGVRAAVVLPGHVGTNIITNSFLGRGLPAPADMTDEQVWELIPEAALEGMAKAGMISEHPSADEMREFLTQMNANFRDSAPVSAAQAATTILDGVRAGTWRILIGEDAKMIDERIRARPEVSYDYAELFGDLMPGSPDSSESSDQG
jgi:NAD(P)-dependent dehydrogenase (short-subunit alcohol dehydrogenase family)